MSKIMKDDAVRMLALGRMEKSGMAPPSVVETEFPDVQGVGPAPDEFNPFDDEADEFDWRAVGHFSDDDE